jgi:hypothetical protein
MWGKPSSLPVRRTFQAGIGATAKLPPGAFTFCRANKSENQSSRRRRLDSGNVQRFAKSRVHAACFETKGQPFYGWCVDGSRNKSQARF